MHGALYSHFPEHSPMEVEQASRNTPRFAWNTLPCRWTLWEHSIVQCLLSLLRALYQAVWTRWEHSTKLFEHAGSTLPSCLNTLRALYQAVWTRWEHSTKLFEHAGSILPSCLNTLGALYQDVWTHWEHSTALTLTESTKVYPAFYARVWRILSTPGALSCARRTPKKHSPWGVHC